MKNEWKSLGVEAPERDTKVRDIKPQIKTKGRSESL